MVREGVAQLQRRRQGRVRPLRWTYLRWRRQSLRYDNRWWRLWRRHGVRDQGLDNSTPRDHPHLRTILLCSKMTAPDYWGGAEVSTESVSGGMLIGIFAGCFFL